MKRVVVTLTAFAVSTGAIAGEPRVTPIESEGQTIRFQIGVPTADLQLARGAVQVSPLPQDHGKFSFSVFYWNRGEQPVNFGIESIEADFNGGFVPVLTVDELIKRAKSRAAWSQVGIALLAGAAAAASANTTTHYRSTTYGPGGRRYHTYGSFRQSNPEAVALAGAAGAAGIYAVQQRLDATKQALGEEVIQTTTVDPDDSYGGTIVLEKLKTPKFPGIIHITINLGGEAYKFAFNVTK